MGNGNQTEIQHNDDMINYPNEFQLSEENHLRQNMELWQKMGQMNLQNLMPNPPQPKLGNSKVSCIQEFWIRRLY